MERLIYNFFNKTKGAISVFLTIILVPMLTISCMFVDASRIKLARAVLESSGDLALNTVLSDYDADLAEIYGLMASSQDTSDAIRKATDYFKSSMVSQGLDQETAGEFAKLVANIGLGESEVEDIDVYDLLGIATNSVEISPVKNGNLSNPAILKSQIIEFSKYRAPIEGISQLCKLFSQINKYVKNSKTDTEIIEEQTKFYNAENEVLSNLVEAYNQLKQIKLTQQVIDDAEDKMNNANNDLGYKSYHHKVVYGLYNFDESIIGMYTDLKLNRPNDFKPYTIPEDSYKSHKAKLETNYSSYKNARDQFSNIAKEIEYSNSVNDVEYWIQTSLKLKGKSSYSSVSKRDYFVNNSTRTSASSVFYEFDYLTEIINRMEESPDEQESYNEIEEILANASSNASDFRYYYRLKTISESGSPSNENRLKSNKQEVNESLNDIATKTNSYKTKADVTITCAEKALIYIDAAEAALIKMKQAYDNWGSKLTDEYCAQSDLAKNNKKDSYDKIDQEVTEKVTEAKLSELKTRVTNIKQYATDASECVKNAKYYDKQISEIKTISDMVNANKISNSNPYLKTDLQNFDNQFSQNFTAFVLTNVKPTAGKTGNNPDLTKDTPELYDWIKTKAVNQKECEYSKEQVEDLNKEQGTKAEENATAEEICDGFAEKSNFEISEQSNLPSKIFNSSEDDSSRGFSSDISNVSNSVGGSFGNVGDKLAKAATDFRDQMFEMYYITSMFSYDTYEYEIKNEIVDQYGNKEAVRDRHALTQLPGQYGKQSTKDAYNEEFVHSTPTNIDINLENNNSYGNELEYILYGGTNASNKAKAYGSIFAIRYAFNLAYAFSNFWPAQKNDTSRSIDAVAVAIATATQGIVPVGLTKTIFILALTAAESAYDISCLKMGMPVVVCKLQNTETWRCQLPTRTGGASIGVSIPSSPGLGNHKADNNDITMRYSDFLKLFLFIKLLSTNGEKDVLTRTADVIQVNMQKQKDNSEYYLKNSVVYYRLSANCKTSFLLMPIPIIKNYTDSIGLDTDKITSFSFKTYRGY